MAGLGGLEETSAEVPGFPHLAVTGYTAINGQAFFPLPFRSNTYQLSNNLTWIRGSHNIKAGVNLRRYNNATLNGANARGNFTFNGQYSGDALADYVLGVPRQAARSFPRNQFGVRLNQNDHFFVQDDWKVSSKMTLNFGLRYEMNYPFKMMNHTSGSVDLANRRVIVATDKDGNINLGAQQVSRILYPLFQDVIVTAESVGLTETMTDFDGNNFAPRIGLAYKLGRDWVIRSGYGIFYGLQKGQRVASALVVAVPFIGDESATFNTSPIPTFDVTNLLKPITPEGTTIGPIGFSTTDPDRADPYIQQWNFTLQKLVGNVLSLEGSYVGNKGTKTEFYHQTNIPTPGPGAIQGRREWTRFGAGTLSSNDGSTIYHAFQSKAQVRGWKGVTLLGTYTWAKAIDFSGGDTSGGVSPISVALERGRADNDIRHRMTLAANYALPFGRSWDNPLAAVVRNWEIGSIITMQSGNPFHPTHTLDRANTGAAGLRPNRLADGNLSSSERTLLRDFDTSAFLLPDQFTYGNSGRNVLNARGLSNWDFLVMRNFAVKEGMRMQLRGEFFGFTNSPQFGAPVANIQAGTFGRILGAGGAREIQLGLKFIF